MNLLIVALMLAAGVVALIVAAQGTEGQVYQTLTGHQAPGWAGGGSSPLGGDHHLGPIPLGPLSGVPFSPVAAHSGPIVGTTA